jgi:hypothetical protein
VQVSFCLCNRPIAAMPLCIGSAILLVEGVGRELSLGRGDALVSAA